jgi:hypothetical protein
MRATDSASWATTAAVEEADNSLGSATGCFALAFFGEVNAPLPDIDANVMAGTASVPFRSVLAEVPNPAAIGEMLRRDSPVPALSPAPGPVLPAC